MAAEPRLFVLLCSLLLQYSTTDGVPICETVGGFPVDPEDIGHSVTYVVNCSQLTEPQIRVVVPETLRGRINTGRYSIGYKCEGNLSSAFNLSNTYFPNQYTRPPWISTVTVPESDALHLAGDNCTFFGCYKYNFSPTGQTVVKTFPESTCVIDTDDCVYAPCQHECMDHIGRYECSCNMGYSLNSDQHNCSDIDECELNIDECDHNCNNTEGSYTCSCILGFALNEDGHTCNDVDECELKIDECDHNCNNTEGSYTCLCDSGYTLNEDGHTCDELNVGSSPEVGGEHVGSSRPTPPEVGGEHVGSSPPTPPEVGDEHVQKGIN